MPDRKPYQRPAARPRDVERLELALGPYGPEWRVCVFWEFGERGFYTAWAPRWMVFPARAAAEK